MGTRGKQTRTASAPSVHGKAPVLQEDIQGESPDQEVKAQLSKASCEAPV